MSTSASPIAAPNTSAPGKPATSPPVASTPVASQPVTSQPIAVPDSAPSHVSVIHELPEDLYNALQSFVGTQPHWSQQQLMVAALSSFLFQHGSGAAAVKQHYLDTLFQTPVAA